MNVPSLPFFRSRPGRSWKPAGEGLRGSSSVRLRRTGLARFESLEPRLPLTVDVTTLNDLGAGSLRQAILDVNKAAVADTIRFNNLATGTIVLASELPTLTNPAGTTFTFSGTTSITLDGASAVAANGLTIGTGANTVSISGINLTLTHFDSGLKFLGGSTGSTIKGLTLTRNNNGIELVGGGFSNTVISGNTITLNDENGIVTGGGVTDLTIGGTAAGAGNTITGNQYGLSFAPGTDTGTVVQGNTISNNNQSGLLLGTAGGTLTGLTIGGTAAGAANTITFNSDSGVEIAQGTYSSTAIAGNVISFNSQSGIVTTGGATGLTIGGTKAGAGNTITYNDEDGVFFQPGTYTGTFVQGNTISLNNASGVLLGTSGGSLTGLTIGGATTADLNTISFNQESGVEVSQGSFTGTVIQGNNIASNASYGIQLSPGGKTISSLTIGGGTTGQGNTIASNALDGIGVFGGSYDGTTVQGNTIRYNLGSGVNINTFAAGGAFSGLQVGGGASGAGNTVTNNGLDGVLVNAGTYVLTAVQGNTIASNARNGVNFYAAFGEKLTGFALGGIGTGEGNTIQNNAASGLAASKGDYTTTSVVGNTISGNVTGISLADAQNLSIGGTSSTFQNTITSNTASGLVASGVLTATKIRGNAFSGNPLGVGLQDAQGVSFGTAETGGGNTVTGGTIGLRAAGNMSSSQVSGNVLTSQTTGMLLINTWGASSTQSFNVGGATATTGNGAGNYVVSSVNGLHAAGTMLHTAIAGNIFGSTGAGGSAMVLDNATYLTVGGSLATQSNTLTAASGNGLWAAGNLYQTGFYRNSLTASTYGAVLYGAQGFLFGSASVAALGNTVQNNKTGVLAVGNCSGSGVCSTIWKNNLRNLRNNAVGLTVYPKA